jgi:hypothetical protein
MKKHLKEKTIGFVLALFLIVGTAISFNLSISTDAKASVKAGCICAERINWLGSCRGATTRLCKGSPSCTSCGGGGIIE